jgi:hypothetical protein
MPNSMQPVDFETHVKPMFRERDRNSMESAFDFWSHDELIEHADAILARLQAGTMPCDGAWPQAQGRPLRTLGRKRSTALTLPGEAARMSKLVRVNSRRLFVLTGFCSSPLS